MGAKDSYSDSSVGGPKVQTAFFSGNSASDSQSNSNGPDFIFANMNAGTSGYESNSSSHS